MEVLILKPSVEIDADSRQLLRDAGVAVIWSDDPQAVRMLRASGEIDGGTMLACALRALASGSDNAYHPATTNRTTLVDLLADAMKNRTEPQR